MIDESEINTARLPERIKHFAVSDYASGIILLLATLAAIWLANGQLSSLYNARLSGDISVNIGSMEITESVRHWFNQILMSTFFLFVGLEIKEELILGNLSSPRKAFLPIAGALGGLALPAAVFIALNWNEPSIVGWAVPTATDPAFAIAILATLENRIPPAVRALLLTLAVVDDLAATLIIAFVYSEGVHFSLLLIGLVIVAALVALNRSGTANLIPYLAMGSVLWIVFVGSGIHSSVAGVMFAFTIPIHAHAKGIDNPLLRLKSRLSSWVHFLILPLFALLNAGVSLADIPFNSHAPLLAAMGVFLGLIFGKPLGIVGGAYLAHKLRLAHLPTEIRWKHVIGIGSLGGIGFTTSLFLANLAYGNGRLFNYIQLSILTGSVIAALAGTLILLAPFQRKQ